MAQVFPTVQSRLAIANATYSPHLIGNTMNQNPKYLKPHDGLTATQRKSLGLEKVPPRVREPGEATSIIVCTASAPRGYSTGDGDVSQPIRGGAMRAMEIASVGVRT